MVLPTRMLKRSENSRVRARYHILDIGIILNDFRSCLFDYSDLSNIDLV